MADYLSPTIIQQTIPDTDMTPLERLLLMHIFDSEPDGNGLCYFAEEAPASMAWIDRAELEIALAVSQAIESKANAYLVAQLAQAPSEQTEIEFDLSVESWEWLFQDIIRRSSTLEYVVAITSFTCSKMRPDGFGGMVTLITADDIRSKSTDALMYELIAEAEYGPLACAPGFGVHVLLHLEKTAVREALPKIIEINRSLTTLPSEAITDHDIRGGCLVVTERTEMIEARDAAIFRAGMAAIRLANMRSSRPG